MSTLRCPHCLGRAFRIVPARPTVALRGVVIGSLIFITCLFSFIVKVEAIRRGLAAVVPVEHLRLFSWDELEVFVCGRKEVDIDLLEACTEYALCCRQDSHVSAFWDVLRSFSPKEKSLFLRYNTDDTLAVTARRKSERVP